MLRPATVVDLPIVRALIREGASRGSFDHALATDSPTAGAFFANLRQALSTGYFVERDPRSGELATVAVPGYVYVPDASGTGHRPIGFGLFKAAAEGYELWLAAVDAAWQDHGQAMLAALLETPPGRQAYVVRVNASGREAPAMAQLLTSLRYACARETTHHAWYLRNDAPEAVRRTFAAAAEVNRTSN